MNNEELPNGWAWARLDQVCEINPRAWATPLSPRDQVSFIPMTAVGAETGEIDKSQTRKWEEIRSKSYTKFLEGDILFAKVTPCMENGKIAIALGLHDGRGVGSTEFHTLRPSDEVSRRYLWHYLLQPSFRAAAEQSMSGAVGLRRVPTGFLREHVLPLPPLTEQLRIVEALDAHLSRLDAAAEAVESAKRHLKPFSASILNRTVLGVSSTVSFDQGSANSSLAQLRNLPSKRFEYATLPPLPEGWFWRRASDVCTLISSGSTPKAHLMHAGSGDVPFLKVYNITQDGQVDFTNKPTYIDQETHEINLKRSRVRPGDVLTNIVGPPLGKTAVVPNQYPEWNINQAITAFRSGPDIHPEWLALILRSPTVIEMLKRTAKATAGQFNIALSTCRELPLPIPPMDVQLKLVKKSAELLEISDRFNKQSAIISLQARKLRQAVLRQAFSGRLVPQNPADESASMSFDRIQPECEFEGSKAKRPTRRPGQTKTDTPSSPDASTAAVQQELPL
ncbi:restriction endonuclease subunit S [Amycolatopsis japonica]|uniref:restriction endonuclease subunit S n=1 Tax=Amycolatopsis japonica TaxID=208439 RepID=UPI00366EC97D